MNGIENFYHGRAASNLNISREADQKNLDEQVKTKLSQEGRSVKDTVSISDEAISRLKADQLKGSSFRAASVTESAKDIALDYSRDNATDRIRDVAEDDVRLFDRFDLDNNGVIALREFEKVIGSTDLSERKQAELVEWFKAAELEADNTAGLTKQEAQRLYNVAQGGQAASFYYYDADGDGVIKKEELQDMVRRNGGDLERLLTIMEQMDLNEDGELTLAEYRYALGSSDIKEDLVNRFDRFDVDNSGTVTLREFSYVLGKQGVPDSKKEEMIDWFKTAQLEADGEEGITKQEAQRLYNVAQGGPASSFYYYDANSDGVITERELSDMVRRNGGDSSLERLMSFMELMDENGNGELTLSEVYKYIREQNEGDDIRLSKLSVERGLADNGKITTR